MYKIEVVYTIYFNLLIALGSHLLWLVIHEFCNLFLSIS
jgi:hypothetical protein